MATSARSPLVADSDDLTERIASWLEVPPSPINAAAVVADGLLAEALDRIHGLTAEVTHLRALIDAVEDDLRSNDRKITPRKFYVLEPKENQ